MNLWQELGVDAVSDGDDVGYMVRQLYKMTFTLEEARCDPDYDKNRIVWIRMELERVLAERMKRNPHFAEPQEGKRVCHEEMLRLMKADLPDEEFEARAAELRNRIKAFHRCLIEEGVIDPLAERARN